MIYYRKPGTVHAYIVGQQIPTPYVQEYYATDPDINQRVFTITHPEYGEVVSHEGNYVLEQTVVKNKKRTKQLVVLSKDQFFLDHEQYNEEDLKADIYLNTLKSA